MARVDSASFKLAPRRVRYGGGGASFHLVIEATPHHLTKYDQI
jgi:hypothetical protein